jgi:hypothetical protein
MEIVTFKSEYSVVVQHWPAVDSRVSFAKTAAIPRFKKKNRRKKLPVSDRPGREPYALRIEGKHERKGYATQAGMIHKAAPAAQLDGLAQPTGSLLVSADSKKIDIGRGAH